jgi:cytidine deaminase
MKPVSLTADMRQALVERALQARRNAYAPYSKYQVGAALLCVDGQVFSGANVENAAYPTVMCAERVAVFNAVSSGVKDFSAIAVASSNGGSPCGSCRQVLAEFGLETLVLVADQDGNVLSEATVGELLPRAFLPGDLNF